MSAEDERRRSPRQQVAATATLETRGRYAPNNQALGSVNNVSMTGIGVETGQPPLPGQEVQLRIAIDDEIHDLTTRATRVDRVGTGNFYEVGLDWSGCTDEQLAFLNRVVQAIAQLQR